MAHSIYKNEVEMPPLPGEGHLEKSHGIADFKDGADPIVFGQAGGPGYKSDMTKIHGQFKEYHWD